jgi:hypothetical protein
MTCGLPSAPAHDLVLRARLRQAGYGETPSVIRIAIPTAAFDAIAATLPLRSVAVETKVNERGVVSGDLTR